MFETFQAIDICKTDSSQVQDKIDVLSKVWGRYGPADGPEVVWGWEGLPMMQGRGYGVRRWEPADGVEMGGWCGAWGACQWCVPKMWVWPARGERTPPLLSVY